MIPQVTLLSLALSFLTLSHGSQPSDSAAVEARYLGELAKLIEIQTEIQELHPRLKRLHPIALVENNRYYIFDVKPGGHHYSLVKVADTDMPIPDGIRASFPLAVYEGRPSCIVTGDVFDSLEGFVTILHEFMHCEQFLCCERGLKEELSIAREAEGRGDFSWEINHPFPYSDPAFRDNYHSFLSSLESRDSSAVRRTRLSLASDLSPKDYEYLVWQEWKEGFARYIENQIRARLGLDPNRFGVGEPYNRITFYVGGSDYISLLAEDRPELIEDLEALYSELAGRGHRTERHLSN